MSKINTYCIVQDLLYRDTAYRYKINLTATWTFSHKGGYLFISENAEVDCTKFNKLGRGTKGE